MRYIILPLLIIGYIVWSYKSIKELIRVNWAIGPRAWKLGLYCDSKAELWAILHLAIIISGIIGLIAHYW